MDYQQQRRATPEEQARFEARMAKRNRRASSRSRNAAAKLIGLGTALFFLVMIIVAMSGN